MIKLKKGKLFIIIALILFTPSCTDEVAKYPVKKEKQFIQDKAGILNNEQNKTLDSVLINYERNTTSEIFVYSVNKIPDTINNEKYSRELVNNLGIGKPGLNNGALIFMSMQDKVVQIKLAYGFEWVVSQEAANNIVRKMVSFFSRSDYYGGIRYAVDSIINISQPVLWQACRGSNQNCVLRVGIKKVITQDNDDIMVETGDGKQLSLNYTRFMSSLVNRIIGGSGDSTSIYCRPINNDEANLLGIAQ